MADPKRLMVDGAKTNGVAFLVLFALAAAIYANSLGVPFVFDDEVDIRDNPAIRIASLSPKALWDAGFGSPAPARFVAYISFALNHYVHGDAVAGYHIVNIAVHALAGMVLFLLVRLTLATPALAGSEVQGHWLAAAAALIWLVNPVQTQSVTYIVQRMTSMAALFYLLALYLYAKGRVVQRSELQVPGVRCQGSGAGHLTSCVKLSSPDKVQKKLDRIDRIHRIFKNITSFVTSVNAVNPSNPVNPVEKIYSLHGAVERQVPGGGGRRPLVYFAGAAVSGLLALGTKQIAFTLPVFVWLYEFYFFRDLDRTWLKGQLRWIGPGLGALAVLALVFVWTNPVSLDKLPDFAKGQFTMGQRLLTQTRVVLFYLGLFLFPHPSRLNIDHDIGLSLSPIDPPVTIVAMAVIAAALAWALWRARSQRLLSFCVLWYLGNLVIESTVIPLALIFEHRAYLPTVGASVALVVLGKRWLGRLHPLGLVVLAVAVGVCSWWTIERNRTWGSVLSIWADSAAKSPNKARPQYNLAHNLHLQGRAAEAVSHYRRAVAIDPRWVEARVNLADALEQLGQAEEAIGQYEQALAIDPQAKQAHFNLGNLLGAQARYDQAIGHYRAALAIDPDYLKARLNLGVALERSGDGTGARLQYAEAAARHPHSPEARFNLGGALAAAGSFAGAIAQLEAALALDPGAADTAALLAQTRRQLAFRLLEQGRIAEAVKPLEAALVLEPGDGATARTLAQAKAAMRGLDEAMARVQAAVDRSPDDLALHLELADICMGKNLADRAAAHYRRALEIQPDLLPAGLGLAEAFGAQGLFDQAAAVWAGLARQHPQQPALAYNAACMFAKAGDGPTAVSWLAVALANGYDNDELIATDPDLDPLRGLPEFGTLVRAGRSDG